MATTGLISRPTPFPVAAGSLKVFSHHLTLYRRVWKGSVFNSFLSPALYLGSLGIGLGSLISHNRLAALGGLSYAAFVAPGMLVSAAMLTGSSESMYPIMARVQWMRTYDAMLASPLGISDLVGGEFLWQLFRLTTVSTVFFLVMLAFHTVASPLGVLAIPVGVLTGLAFSLPIMAWSALQHLDSWFAVVYRFVITPLFILGGTFFPISSLPVFVQPIAWITPLAHGVALARALTSGTPRLAPALLHLVVLLVFAVAGLIAARITFKVRLAA